MGKTYKVKLPNNKAYEILVHKDELKLNQKDVNLDIANTGEGEWSVINNHNSYLVKVVSIDIEKKQISLLVNQEIFHLEIEDELDELLNKMGMNKGGSAKMDKVAAPMPGMVLNILAKVGQQIQKGDPLLILEAMKMENIIKAVGEGVIKSILIKNQDTVEKNQILIEME